MSILKPEEKKPYTALYRQWRPQLFSQVVGQEHVTRTLQNALVADRVAHAYLFCGLRGTGKTTMAKLLAKALNCLEGVNREPCNRCRSCREVAGGRNMDVLEIDAASNRGIDEIRELREKVRYVAAQNRYKVYIIDEVHMLTNEAFNALLKTLEEPPSKVVFILATTEVHKLPLTVVSRCQRFDFRLLQVEEIAAFLGDISAEMNFVVEKETLYLLARLAEGSLRDALGFLEQCRAFGGEKINFEQALEILGLTAPETAFNLLGAVADETIAAGLSIIRETVHQGRDLHRFIRELILYLRKLVILQTGLDEEEILKDVPGLKPYLLQQKGIFAGTVLLEMLEILQQLIYELKGSSQPQFLLELAFLRLLRAYRFRDYLSPGTLFSRLEELEEKLQSIGLEGLSGRISPPTQSAVAGAVLKAEGEILATSGVSATVKGNGTVPESSEAELREGTVEIDPGELQEFWDTHLLPELKKQRKHIIHALLQEGYPFSCEKGIFTISFPSTHSVLKGRIESKEHSSYIETLLEQLLGKKVRLKIILQEKTEVEGGKKVAKTETAEKKIDFPLKEREKNYENRGGDSSFIHQMLELFDGRLIETGAKKLGSRDFWTFSLEELDCEPQEEEDEVPF